MRAQTAHQRLQYWKLVHLLKGLATWVPILNAWRLRNPNVDGSESARYCYSVWLRHLSKLHSRGFDVRGAQIGELGPGDSLGTGLAALLSGADRYIGLDLMPYSAKSDLVKMLDELAALYASRTAIPDDGEFPIMWPRLDSYAYPEHLLDVAGFGRRREAIRQELPHWHTGGRYVSYKAPWTRLEDVPLASLDLIVSQAVLEHVDDLEQTYRAMAAWLKPGGYASHVIGFCSHHLAPSWNGHWAYSDLEWRIVRGCREFLINREPLSTHLAWAHRVGFDVLLVERQYDEGGLGLPELSPRFQQLDAEDVRTFGVMLVFRKR